MQQAESHLQLGILNTDKLSEINHHLYSKDIRVFKLWSRPGLRNMKWTRNCSSDLNNSRNLKK